ncbi:MAG: hypothetical protein ABI422_04665 [Sphingomicrobium sp.]
MKLQTVRGTMFAAALAAIAVPAPALAWGKTGHRVIAAIADTFDAGLDLDAWLATNPTAPAIGRTTDVTKTP